MKKAWPTTTLGEVLQKTETINPLQSPEAEFDYIDVSSVSNETFQIEATQRLKGKDAPSRARKLVRENDILFATIRPTLRRIAVVPESLDKQVCSTGYFVLRPKPGVDHRFVFYFLFTQAFTEQMQSLQKGASYPAVTDGDVKAQLIPVPSLPEQRRIVSILNKVFEGIATAKANAEKNLRNANALFESHLHSSFSQRRNGWVVRKLGDVCEYENGKAHEQCIDENGRFIVINSKFISSEGAVFKKSHQALLLLHPGDITMVLSDVPNGKALAKCYLVEEENTYTLNQRICLIRSMHFHPQFLYYQLNRNKHFLALDNGENQTNMRLSQVLSCPLFLPPISEQKAVAADLEAMSDHARHLESIYEQKLTALDELKKSLLYSAFHGAL